MLKISHVEFNEKQCSLLIIKDMEDFVQLEKEKNEHRVVELLSATASHEMRNPLN